MHVDTLSTAWAELVKPLQDLPAPKRVIIAPVLDDFTSAARLLHETVKELYDVDHSRTLFLFVNDGSLKPPPPEFPFDIDLPRVGVLHLRANLGHQRAIAAALGFVSHWIAPDATVLVMDADGEDRPQDAQELLRLSAENPNSIIVAYRARRSETLIFRIGYVCYRLLFHMLTGQRIRHGNFSAMTGRTVQRLAHLAGLWNHYAATIQISRIPVLGVEADRGARYADTSRMNLIALIQHGLSAISVHMETVGVRILLGALFVSLLAGIGLVTVVAIRLTTELAIPGWASLLGASFMILAVLGLMLSVQLVFMVLAARERLPVIAAVDALRFIRDFELFSK
jgi:hypothetical protein